ncbi:hypothetical protein ACIRL2_47220 [Embleya sp. NPDC127516]|uniref:hypothetical protein n=1 Tax=Embleya sp. NPDC127516 TaxID=3363990 RepID=UPI00380C6611
MIYSRNLTLLENGGTMRALVTGASGTIASAVTRSLLRQGHAVVGTTTSGGRSPTPEGVETFAADLFEAGAPTDGQRGRRRARGVEERRTGGRTRPNSGRRPGRGVHGNDRPLVYTGGLWLRGNVGSTPLTADSPLAPPMVVAWHPALEEILVEAASRRVRTVRIRPGLDYGGAGYVPLLLPPQDTDDGRVVRHFGDESNRWAVVHADDLGDLYAPAVERAPAGSVHLGANEEPVPVRDAAKAAADKHGAQVQHWNPADAQRCWNVMGEALMVDRAASSAKARAELAWDRPGTASSTNPPRHDHIHTLPPRPASRADRGKATRHMNHRPVPPSPHSGSRGNA